jgi:hypothetical protein
MDATDNTSKAPGPALAAARAAGGGAAASAPVSDHPLGPDAVAILATEHWSLIAARSLLWNEAYSRTTIFLGALSAAIVALDRARSGVLLQHQPHDDERGLTASSMLASFGGRGLRPWGHFLSNTPTVIATINAALAAAIAVLAVRKAGAATALAVAVGAVAFLVVWTAPFLLQRQSLSPLRRSKPRFPTPPPSHLCVIATWRTTVR